jgi:hypothetical protein
VHSQFAYSLWAQHKYAQTIQEFATAARLIDDKNKAEFEAALNAGFHSGAWPGALRQAIEVLLAQRQKRLPMYLPI